MVETNDKCASLTAENERLAKRIEILQADNDKLLCDAIDNLIVKDENESLRNRCEELRKTLLERDSRIHQLERLVCSDIRIELDASVSLWCAMELKPDCQPKHIKVSGTLQAAIDAAIRHMEAGE